MTTCLTVRDVIVLATRYLKEHGSDSPRLDAEVLTAHALGIRRLDLYLDPERPLNSGETAVLREYVRRRGGGEPVAYITGRREFYGIEFAVSRDVLIPRPETEVLVDAVLEGLCGREHPLVVDVGTGSGAIACAVAARHPTARVVATDISFPALLSARMNVQRIVPDGRVRLISMDVLIGLGEKSFADAVVSNPPYVAEHDPLDEAARRFEPKVALFCADEGREVTSRLLAQAWSRLKPDGFLAIEVGSNHHREWVEGLLQSGAWRGVRTLRDAAGEVRGYLATRRQ